MLELKEIKITETREEVINQYEMINRYFWSSRSVYAVEFKRDVYPNAHNGEVWNEITLIEVQFENNIILSHKQTFCKSHPIIPKNMRESWAKDLIYAYSQDDSYYDYRTKEQFDKDFDLTINNLKSIRC